MDPPEQPTPKHRPTDGVVDNPARSRFELVRDGQIVAIAEYRPTEEDGSVLLMPHTVVDQDKRGHGLGAILVQGALVQIRERGQTVIPQCWFVAEFIDAHPDFADLVAH